MGAGFKNLQWEKSGREEEDRHLFCDHKEQQKKNPFNHRNQGLNSVLVVCWPQKKRSVPRWCYCLMDLGSSRQGQQCCTSKGFSSLKCLQCLSHWPASCQKVKTWAASGEFLTVYRETAFVLHIDSEIKEYNRRTGNWCTACQAYWFTLLNVAVLTNRLCLIALANSNHYPCRTSAKVSFKTCPPFLLGLVSISLFNSGLVCVPFGTWAAAGAQIHLWDWADHADTGKQIIVSFLATRFYWENRLVCILILW